MAKRILLLITVSVALIAAYVSTSGDKSLRIALAAGQKFAGGPYVVGVTSKSATVAWVVQVDEVTFRPPAGAAVLTAPALKVQTSTLTGLQPDTRYEYNVGSGGDEGKGYFKTAPSSSEMSYRFDVYGDNRTRPDVHAKVIS